MTGEGSKGPSRWLRWPSPGAGLGLVGLVFVLRMALIGAVGLGDDEAYYALWARHLDWSYFDHPPGVALLVAASVSALGEGPFAVRLPTLLCGAATVGVLLRLARRMGTSATTELALLLVLSPMFAILGVFTAPDMPFLLALSLALSFAWEALEAEDAGAWLPCGISTGIALLCKYNAVLWLVTLLVLLVSDRRYRRWLLRPEPYLGLLVALLIFAPVLVWNSHHDWMSFRFHLQGRHGGALDLPTNLGQFVGSQLGLLSPLVAVALVLGLRDSLRRARAGAAADRFLLAAALPPLLLFGLTSPLTAFKPHWTASGWLPALLPAARWLSERPRLRLATLGSAGLMSGLVYLQALWPVLPLGPKADVTNDLYGWPEAGAAVERALHALPDPDQAYVFGHMYQTAAQIALQLPRSVIVTRRGGRADQFDVWRERLPELAGRDAIFVAHDRYDLDLVRRPFPGLDCARAEEVPVLRRGEVVRRFQIWSCRATPHPSGSTGPPG